MAKLYFRYAAMDAGKTLDLLKVAYNYEDRGRKVLIMTAGIDNRFGTGKVASRVGITREALSIFANDNLFEIVKNYPEKIACVLLDEIQFFTVEQIQQLADIVDELDIPVICYGLRSDYMGGTFAASAQLMAIADSIEEVKTICHCGRKATMNMLVKNGVAIKKGSQVVVDNDETHEQNIKYLSVCRKHWKAGRWEK
ncbi:MAG: thymidine kinase [Negativicutes bacterium]